MKQIYILNQTYPKLAREELESVIDTTVNVFSERIVTGEPSDEAIAQDLALCHETWDYLTSFPVEKKQSFLVLLTESFPESIIDTLQHHTFAFRFEKHSEHHNHSLSENEVANYIHDILVKKGISPTVDLKKPDILIKGIIQNNHCFLGIQRYVADQSWQKRRPHLRPKQKPISLSPRLAHALVNCLRAKSDETIIDPFCGTGGFLLEGKRLGKKICGGDIDQQMVSIAQDNLTAYGFSNTSITVQDAFSIQKRYPYLITDLPYFKNTKQTMSLSFYTDVLQHFVPLIQKRIVLCLPDNEEIVQSITPVLDRFPIEIKEYTIYLHRSLQKKIYLISKKRVTDE